MVFVHRSATIDQKECLFKGNFFIELYKTPTERRTDISVHMGEFTQREHVLVASTQIKTEWDPHPRPSMVPCPATTPQKATTVLTFASVCPSNRIACVDVL